MRDDEWQNPLIGGIGTKGYPHQAAPVRRADIAARGWNLLRDDLPLPLAVIRRDALAGNLRWMQQFARDRGLDLAPHGKTTMSPQLFDAQLRAGAWGITFANVTQARLGLASGVRRALIANHLATTSESISRSLRVLESAGTIRFDRHTIVITDLPALRELAQ